MIYEQPLPPSCMLGMTAADCCGYNLYCLYLVMVVAAGILSPTVKVLEWDKGMGGPWDDLQSAPARQMAHTDCWHCNIHGHENIGLSEKKQYWAACPKYPVSAAAETWEANLNITHIWERIKLPVIALESFKWSLYQ